MKKFAAYQTNKRKFDDGGGRGRGRGRGRGGGDVKRGRFEKPRGNKPREGREPELNIFIDQKFNIWNLPSKAKVVLVSNLPEVGHLLSNDVCTVLFLFSAFVNQTCSTIFSHFTETLRGSDLSEGRTVVP